MAVFISSTFVLLCMASLEYGTLAEPAIGAGSNLFLVMDASAMNPSIAVLLGLLDQKPMDSLMMTTGGRRLQLDTKGRRLARQHQQDGVTCPSRAWTVFNGTCYASLSTPGPDGISFYQALSTCRKANPAASLASIPNKEVNDFLTRLAPNTGSPRWIGAFWKGNNPGGEGHVWLRRDVPMNYRNFGTSWFGWDSDQQTADVFTNRGRPDTVTLDPSGSWTGRYFRLEKFPGYICEYKPGAEYQAPIILSGGRNRDQLF